MSLQALKFELDDTKVFQELVEVMKSVSSVRFPKLVKKLANYNNYYEQLRASISFSLRELSSLKTKFNYDEKFRGLGRTYEVNDKLLEILIENQDYSKFFYFDEKNEKPTKNIIIVICSNRGFCGSFNKILISAIDKKLEELKLQETENEFCIIGNVLGNMNRFRSSAKIKFPEGKILIPDTDVFEVEVNKIYEAFILDKILLYKNVRFFVISNFLKVYPNGQHKVETSVYNLLPYKAFAETKEEKDPYSRKIRFYPTPEVAVANLIEVYLKSKLTHLMLQSEIAENYLRMQSMSQASDKIKDHIAFLEKEIRKLRQRNITKQLIELMAAGLALDEMN